MLQRLMHSMTFCRVDVYIHTDTAGKYVTSGISNADVIFYSIVMRGLRNIIVGTHDNVRKIGKNYD